MPPLTPLPVFLDLADGTGAPGTPTSLGTKNPLGSFIVDGPNGASDYVLQESSESPTWERAEQSTVTKAFTEVPKNDGFTYMQGLGRGVLQTDNENNQFTILSSQFKRSRGNKWGISIVSESRSFDVPPDEFQIVPVELGLDILKHPRYRLALDPTIADSSNTVTVPGDANATVSVSWVKQSIIRAVQTYRDSPVFPSVDNINGLFQNNILIQFNTNSIQVPFQCGSSPNGPPAFNPQPAGANAPVSPGAPVAWDGNQVGTTKTPTAFTSNCQYVLVTVPISAPAIQFALAAAMELIQKLWRLEDTPYITGYQITLARYSFRPPFMNPGGYIENPITQANPPLPDYFWNPNPTNEPNPPNAGVPIVPVATIFDNFAALNTQCYSDDGVDTAPSDVSISWLRKADEMEFQRTWFRLTSTWIGYPTGSWDFCIYSGGPRPTLATYTQPPPTGYQKLM